MDSDASHGVQASKVALGDSIRSSVASFLSYLELRLKLLGLETRETGLHLLVLALLLVSTITFLAGFIAMLTVFLLYLMMLILHWEWGWSAPGSCRSASCYQYCSGTDFQVQDC
jgi:uncharacterized membrane protein YqjE